MTDHPLATWHRLVRTHDPSGLNALLAEDAVFHSPVVHTPQRGRKLVVKQAPDAFEVDVTECLYAKFYKEMGTPELGFLLTCSVDFPMTEGFGADVQFTRTQTIMQGASHCDFRYRLK